MFDNIPHSLEWDQFNNTTIEHKVNEKLDRLWKVSHRAICVYNTESLEKVEDTLPVFLRQDFFGFGLDFGNFVTDLILAQYRGTENELLGSEDSEESTK